MTLFEGEHHYGVGALLNSLVSSDFKGLVIVGYRGVLPPWINQLEAIQETTFQLSDNIVVAFEAVITDYHFAYYKPFFIKSVLQRHQEVKNVFYFDPDIVVNASWDFFTQWVNSGISLCLDNAFSFVHHNHPWRQEWKSLYDEQVVCNKVDYYINSGFVGIARKDIAVIDRWIDITHKYQGAGGSITSIDQNPQSAFKGDQDLLNAVITVSPDLTYSIIGHEGMGFTMPAYVMTHAVGQGLKPWNTNFVTLLFKIGRRPKTAEINFFNYCQKPVKIYSEKQIFTKRLNLKLASLLGRVIGF